MKVTIFRRSGCAWKLPFSEGAVAHESKQEVFKIVSLVKLSEKLPCVSSPLKFSGLIFRRNSLSRKAKQEITEFVSLLIKGKNFYWVCQVQLFQWFNFRKRHVNKYEVSQFVSHVEKTENLKSVFSIRRDLLCRKANRKPQIMKTRLYKFDPQTPLLYSKWGL